MEMTILEFVSKHCQDIVSDYKDNSKLVDLDILPYEEIIDDPESEGKIKVVYVDSQPVNIRDFIEMEKPEFLEAHPTPSASESFDNYLDSIIIIEGPELVNYLRNKIRAQAEHVMDYSSVYNLV